MSATNIPGYVGISRREALQLLDRFAAEPPPPADAPAQDQDWAKAVAVLLGLINDMEIITAFDKVFRKYGAK
ncbi:hypothetical protein [Nocardioides sp.]|uniref:hypothetical protein n=1 Tax=Nocardioides sp. TaxID=35761 RepID=UPI002CD248DE|nr:hypothetical protein [Nocardioides sp.]HXH79554.1 hypothetical protein [Nocardioides sp.]